MSHGHDHSHSGHSHGHDHDDHGRPTGPNDGPSSEATLLPFIDLPNIRALNVAESADNRPANPFKPWTSRATSTPSLVSDADEQLIITIPFLGDVRLVSINVAGPPESAPTRVKLFCNRDDVDFDNADDLPAVQEVELPANPNGEIDIPLKTTKLPFRSVATLVMYFTTNAGSETSTISYIGLKGVYTSLKRAPVTAVYEARAQLKDHKTPADMKGASSLGM